MAKSFQGRTALLFLTSYKNHCDLREGKNQFRQSDIRQAKTYSRETPSAVRSPLWEACPLPLMLITLSIVLEWVSVRWMKLLKVRLIQCEHYIYSSSGCQKCYMISEKISVANLSNRESSAEIATYLISCSLFVLYCYKKPLKATRISVFASCRKRLCCAEF